jgi:hypothetical protein
MKGNAAASAKTTSQSSRSFFDRSFATATIDSFASAPTT